RRGGQCRQHPGLSGAASGCWLGRQPEHRMRWLGDRGFRGLVEADPLAVFVSNDTGPVHIAAAVGTPIVVLIDLPTPHAYIPMADSQRLIFSESINRIEVEDAYAATRELLSAGRTEKLFAS
ncbi:MAG: glycosyltransferase family 9 protein, partial [Acidobacteriota bacterium]